MKLSTSTLFAILLSQHCLPTYAARSLRGDDAARIIGGDEATEDRFSYAVSIQDRSGHGCGGSLIAKDVILSAAHCGGGQYDVVLGRHDFNDNDGEVIAMKRELPHPNYNERTTDNDFMLVFLDKAVSVNNVDLVKLNSDSSTPSVGQEVTVVGWGDTDIRDDVEEISDVLMAVEVNAISNQECDDSEGTIGGVPDDYNGQITENMLCAKANLKDSCNGDSGGPLVIKGTSAENDIQVGVVSWGVGCAERSFPGVYARVSRAYDWIQREVCKGSSYASEAGFDCDNDGGGGTTDDSFDDDGGTTDDSFDDDDDSNTYEPTTMLPTFMPTSVDDSTFDDYYYVDDNFDDNFDDHFDDHFDDDGDYYYY